MISFLSTDANGVAWSMARMLRCHSIAGTNLMLVIVADSSAQHAPEEWVHFHSSISVRGAVASQGTAGGQSTYIGGCDPETVSSIEEDMSDAETGGACRAVRCSRASSAVAEIDTRV